MVKVHIHFHPQSSQFTAAVLRVPLIPERLCFLALYPAPLKFVATDLSLGFGAGENRTVGKVLAAQAMKDLLRPLEVRNAIVAFSRIALEPQLWHEETGGSLGPH